MHFSYTSWKNFFSSSVTKLKTGTCQQSDSSHAKQIRTLNKDIDSQTKLEKKTGHTASNKSLPLRTENILIVEDAMINQILIVNILQQQGFSPSCVNNGQEAVNAYLANKYHLILMDLQMPIMDGYTATAQIRNIEQTQQSNNTPIIALTANTTKGISEKVYAIGMNDFLTKPFKADTIKSTLAKWLPAHPLKDTPTDNAQTVIDGELRKTPIIEVSVLDSLERSIGANNLHNLLLMTTVEIEKRIATLAHLATTNNRTLLKITAHGLKGESGSLGALSLAEACKKMEFMAEQAPENEIRLQIQRINIITTETLIALKARIEAGKVK
ncbi:MAG: response regulator [Methyloprofundus sp.]|nr:response regulator [Methyloprofundus sp.]